MPWLVQGGGENRPMHKASGSACVCRRTSNSDTQGVRKSCAKKEEMDRKNIIILKHNMNMIGTFKQVHYNFQH